MRELDVGEVDIIAIGGERWMILVVGRVGNRDRRRQPLDADTSVERLKGNAERNVLRGHGKSAVIGFDVEARVFTGVNDRYDDTLFRYRPERCFRAASRALGRKLPTPVGGDLVAGGAESPGFQARDLPAR